MKKKEVLNIIDEVMNNREIDSIRNAILAIRDKVLELEDNEESLNKDYYARLKVRSRNELALIKPIPLNAKYLVIDSSYKIDSGFYGAYWFETEEGEE